MFLKIFLLYVFVPYAYLLILPSLSFIVVDEFNNTFSVKPNNLQELSISNYLNSPQASALFAATTSLSIHYLWTNNIYLKYKTLVLRINAILYTLGWILFLCFPTGNTMGHGIAITITFLAFVFYAFGVFQCIKFDIALISLIILNIILSLLWICSAFLTNRYVFIVIEYLLAFTKLLFLPLANYSFSQT